LQKSQTPSADLDETVKLPDDFNERNFYERIISIQKDVVVAPHSMLEVCLCPGTYYSDTKEMLYACMSSKKGETNFLAANMIINIQLVGIM